MCCNLKFVGGLSGSFEGFFRIFNKIRIKLAFRVLSGRMNSFLAKNKYSRWIFVSGKFWATSCRFPFFLIFSNYHFRIFTNTFGMPGVIFFEIYIFSHHCSIFRFLLGHITTNDVNIYVMPLSNNVPSGHPSKKHSFQYIAIMLLWNVGY